MLPEGYSYEPLLDYLTIKDSNIEGIGLFTTEDIKDQEYLGESHNVSNRGLKRTPLGGFINHSSNPNCEIDKIYDKDDYKEYGLFTLRKINKGEELTVNYNEAICGIPEVCNLKQ